MEDITHHEIEGDLGGGEHAGYIGGGGEGYGGGVDHGGIGYGGGFEEGGHEGGYGGGGDVGYGGGGDIGYGGGHEGGYGGGFGAGYGGGGYGGEHGGYGGGQHGGYGGDGWHSESHHSDNYNGHPHMDISIPDNGHFHDGAVHYTNGHTIHHNRYASFRCSFSSSIFSFFLISFFSFIFFPHLSFLPSFLPSVIYTP